MDAHDRDPIIEALGLCVLICDTAGRLVYASASIRDEIGWAPHEITGRLIGTLLAPDPTGLNTPRNGQNDPPTFTTFLRPNGTPVSVLCSRRDVSRPEPRQIWLLGHSTIGSQRSRYAGVASSLACRLGPRPELDAVLRETLETWLGPLGAREARIWLLEPGSGRLALRAAGDGSGVCVRAWGMVQPGDASWPDPDDLVRARAGSVVLADGEAATPFVVSPLRSGMETLGVAAIAVEHATGPEWHAAFSATAEVAANGLAAAELRRRDDLARREEAAEHRRLRLLLDLTPVAVVLAEGPNLQLTLVNPQARALCGRPSPPRTLDEFHEQWTASSDDGKPYELPQQPLWRASHWGETVSETLRLRGPDGQARVVEVRAHPFPGPRGGAIATYNDITDRADVQAELTERAAQVKALLDHLPVGVAYFDSRGVCRACNGFSWRVLGLTRSQVMSARVDDLFRDAPLLASALHLCIEKCIPHVQGSTPWQPPGKSSAPSHLEWRFEPLPHSAGGEPQGALALIVDVTARKEADDALRAAKEEAEQSARSKARFLSAISHDLRTPVNALNLQAKIVSESLAGEVGSILARESDPHRVVHGLQQASANLVELVNDLLDITRFDSGEASQHLADFDLREWLESTLNPLGFEAREKGLAFRWTLSAEAPKIRADRVKLGRVLTNLVGNALKFTEWGSIEIFMELRERNILWFCVCDTGPGIAADQIGRIFDEFAQLRNPERDRSKGTGLGLAICRRLVEAVSGSVEVESEPGRGSTFTVYYPVEAAEPSAPPREEGEGEELDFAHSPQESRILLVEDDQATRESMTLLLESVGCTVTPTADGFKALEQLKERSFDLVLLDLMMPGMEGTEVLRRIREVLRLADLPVLILSGDVLDDRATHLRDLGATETISKPVDIDYLLAMVAQHTSLELEPIAIES